MNEQVIENSKNTSFTSPKHWQRFIFMLLFLVILHVASIALWVLVPLQFLFTLVTDGQNDNLLMMGKSIAKYVHQILEYLTFNTEQKAFPFSDWPKSEPVQLNQD